MRAVIQSAACLAMLAVSSLSQAAVPNVAVAGLLEVEAARAEDYAGATSNTISLATLELALNAPISERLSAYVGFLYEEDATDFGLDEGFVTLELSDSWSLTAGKIYVPFGRFETFMVSDPQTLELAETTETVVMLSVKNRGLYGSAFLFNGDSNEASEVNAGDDTVIDTGLNLGYADEGRFDVGLTYVTNIADSNSLQELTTSGAATGVVERSVAGASIYFSATIGRFTVLGEHMSALDNFRNGDLDGAVTKEEQPSASNIELGFELADDVIVAAAYQKTRDAYFLGLPETVASASFAFGLVEGAALAVEYASSKDYGVSDGGSGETATTVTAQLAVEF